MNDVGSWVFLVMVTSLIAGFFYVVKQRNKLSDDNWDLRQANIRLQRRIAEMEEEILSLEQADTQFKEERGWE